MNKIIINIGLIIFCLSVVFFSRMELSLDKVVINSIILFAITTIMLSVIIIIFIKSVNKASESKQDALQESSNGG